MVPSLVFDGWDGILRTLLLGTACYGALVLFLRLSGKRTLAKMNAFDLVVTVALGSTLATILLDDRVALAEGAVALGLLVALQFIVAWWGTRFRTFERAVKAQPSLLAYRGRLQSEVMRRERVTASEVEAALRAAGVSRLEDAHAVVLEGDGNLSVLPVQRGEHEELVEGLRGT